VKHFSEQVWIDFVRGTGSATWNCEIDAHLASNCTECLGAHTRWQQVYAIVTGEPNLAEPERLNTVASDELRSTQTPESGAWIMARSVFDSLHRPVSAGIRSGVSDTRQMLFDAEGTMVDLVLEIRPQSNTVSLAGQVVYRDRVSVAPRGASIVSWTDQGRRLAKARANEWGEFQMEFVAQERLRLSVEIVGSKPIRIPPLTLNRNAVRGVS
jgi:hypothetical protein